MRPPRSRPPGGLLHGLLHGFGQDAVEYGFYGLVLLSSPLWLACLAASALLDVITLRFFGRSRLVTPKQRPGGVILITGCERRHAGELAMDLVEDGWTVYAASATTEGVQALREEAQARAGEASTHSNGGLMMPRSSYPALNGSGGRLVPLRMEGSDPSSVKGVVSRMSADCPEGQKPSLFALVNAEMMVAAGAVDWMNPAEVQRVMEVNYGGMVSVTMAMLPLLRRKAGSRIINMTSTLAGSPMLASLAAACQATQAFTASLRHELRPLGLHVSTVVAPISPQDPVNIRDIRDSLLQSWSRVDDSRRGADYGGDGYVRAALRVARSQTSEYSLHPVHIAEVMRQAVLSPEPRPEYRVGFNARFTTTFLSFLPPRVREAMMEWKVNSNLSPSSPSCSPPPSPTGSAPAPASMRHKAVNGHRNGHHHHPSASTLTSCSSMRSLSSSSSSDEISSLLLETPPTPSVKTLESRGLRRVNSAINTSSTTPATPLTFAESAPARQQPYLYTPKRSGRPPLGLSLSMDESAAAAPPTSLRTVPMSPVTDGFRSQQSSSTVTRLRLPPRTQSEQNLVEMQQECPVMRKMKENYELSTTVGTGGFSVVRLGKCRKTGDKVALKIIRKEAMRTAKAMDLVTQEMKVLDHLKGMSHPNVIRYIDRLEDPEGIIMIMEYCPGGDLFQHVLRMGSYTVREASTTTRHILRGLSAIHEIGIIHRDVKPENCMYGLDPSTGELTLKIIDFGLALFRTGNGPVKASIAGTPRYMSPEAIMYQEYSDKSDVWAAGVILYALLCGTCPFRGTTHDEIFSKIKKGEYIFEDRVWADIGDEAKDTIKILLQTDPAKRPTAKEALQIPFIRGDESIIQIAQDLPLEKTRSSFRKFTTKIRVKAVARAVLAQAMSKRGGGSRPPPSPITLSNWASSPPAFPSLPEEPSASPTRGSSQRSSEKLMVQDLTALVCDGMDLLTPAELAVLQRVYREEADPRGLDLNTFRKVMRQLGKDSYPLRRLFMLFDTNRNGFIDSEELIQGFQKLHPQGEAAVQFLFDIVNEDGSGVISEAEFARFLILHRQRLLLQHRQQLIRTVDLPLIEKTVDLDPEGYRLTETIAQVFAELDEEGKGIITREAFIEGARRRPDFVALLMGHSLDSTSPPSSSPNSSLRETNRSPPSTSPNGSLRNPDGGLPPGMRSASASPNERRATPPTGGSSPNGSLRDEGQ